MGEMTQTPNPFTNRGPVTNPEDFFGRKDELATILTRLQSLQCVSIVGERRIGKSSLLAEAETGRQTDLAPRQHLGERKVISEGMR